MKITTIYKQRLPAGVVIVSLEPPRNAAIRFETAVRLEAEEGMLLTNGEVLTDCIDASTADGWSEVEDPYYLLRSDIH